MAARNSKAGKFYYPQSEISLTEFFRHLTAVDFNTIRKPCKTDTKKNFIKVVYLLALFVICE
jgi:hypothetical protein